jgi:hypothetical protein
MEMEADLAWIILIGFSTVGIEGKRRQVSFAYSLGGMLKVWIHGSPCNCSVRVTMGRVMNK